VIVNLSYPLSERTPFYEGLDKPRLERVYDLAKGDACNSFYFRSSNHAGTHVDGPYHFNAAGRRISDYGMEELVFSRPAILALDVPEDRLIRAHHLREAETISPDCDVVLVRTGFSHYRETDPGEYVNRNPGFSRDAAEYLVATLPDLKALIVDSISIASSLHMEAGCDAHRVFLGCTSSGDRTVLLVEDANLPATLPVPQRIWVVPLFFEGLDSAPCTVIAEL
jgi:arylformamidase